MKNDGDRRCIFRLTSLQIGDLQSYRSDLALFLAFESKKLYILVDNQPWLKDGGPRPAHLWQLMVTKSRLSPFANKKIRRGKKEGHEVVAKSIDFKEKKNQRWFSLIDAATLSHGTLPVKKLKSSLCFTSELCRILHGFIIFEVAWANVRGINYTNDLLTDTCLAIEAKLMRRWEFESLDEAAMNMSSWFSGTQAETSCLKEYLDTAVGDVFSDAQEDLSGTLHVDNHKNIFIKNLSLESNSQHHLGDSFGVYPETFKDETMELRTPPPAESYRRQRVTDLAVYLEESQKKIDDSSGNSPNNSSDDESAAEPTQYKDILVMFRFNDHNLPFKLRQIIMSDYRLLTLLETGLPSWVIFLQSYPGFCHLYRPWMCPLARALYVLISLITVIIGFYDLYKNVPLLKATASRLCGPLFDWIETWDMVSRIKYLGTMLILHHLQRPVNWILTVVSAARPFFLVLLIPLAKPFMEFLDFLLPLWNSLVEVVDSFFSVISIAVGEVVEVLVLPIWSALSLIWSFAASVIHSIIWIFSEIVCTPIRMVIAIANILALLCYYAVDVLQDIWLSTNSMLHLFSDTQATVRTYEISIWRSLWNDLFSKVFRSVRSILNGFVAFFTACNRHRLSIYSYIQDFIQRLLGQPPIHESSSSSRQRQGYQQYTVESRRKVHIN